MTSIREESDSSLAAALTVAINALPDEPIPSEALRVPALTDIYCLAVQRKEVIYRVDDVEGLVIVIEIRPRPESEFDA